ncbi:MAG: hypothetical protein M1819_002401 [Sarea resinae]|nr:MAG: hypothetical protein M1819_002401 [Sarea resinae]
MASRVPPNPRAGAGRRVIRLPRIGRSLASVDLQTEALEQLHRFLGRDEELGKSNTSDADYSEPALSRDLARVRHIHAAMVERIKELKAKDGYVDVTMIEEEKLADAEKGLDRLLVEEMPGIDDDITLPRRQYAVAWAARILTEVYHVPESLLDPGKVRAFEQFDAGSAPEQALVTEGTLWRPTDPEVSEALTHIIGPGDEWTIAQLCQAIKAATDEAAYQTAAAIRHQEREFQKELADGMTIQANLEADLEIAQADLASAEANVAERDDQISDLQTTVTELAGDAEAARRSKNDVEQKYQESLEDMRRFRDNYNVARTAEQTTLDELQISKRRLEDTIVGKDATIHKLEDAAERLRLTIEKRGQIMTELERTVQALENSIEQSNNQRQAADNSKAVETQRLKDSFEALQRKIEDLQNAASDKATTIEELQSTLAAKEEASSAFNVELQTLRDNNAANVSTLQERDEHVRLLCETLIASRDENAANDATLKDMQGVLADKDIIISALKMELLFLQASNAADPSTLENLQESLADKDKTISALRLEMQTVRDRTTAEAADLSRRLQERQTGESVMMMLADSQCLGKSLSMAEIAQVIRHLGIEETEWTEDMAVTRGHELVRFADKYPGTPTATATPQPTVHFLFALLRRNQMATTERLLWIQQILDKEAIESWTVVMLRALLKPVLVSPARHGLDRAMALILMARLHLMCPDLSLPIDETPDDLLGMGAYQILGYATDHAQSESLKLSLPSIIWNLHGQSEVQGGTTNHWLFRLVDVPEENRYVTLVRDDTSVGVFDEKEGVVSYFANDFTIDGDATGVFVRWGSGESVVVEKGSALRKYLQVLRLDDLLDALFRMVEAASAANAEQIRLLRQ